jgi:co-chaperonin GroES (HSP10)
MKFKPETLAYRLVLKPFIETMSKGGIAIARDERSQAINTDKGEVFLIGPSCWDRLERKPEIKAGDKVMYAKWGAKMIQDPDTGEFYVICNDEDILVGFE